MEFRSYISFGSRQIVFAAVIVLAFSASLEAQPPWSRGGDRGRDDRGRDDRGRDDRWGGGRDDWMNRVDPSQMLRRADKNGDGKVDPDEIDERFRGFTTRLIERYGMDPRKPVVLDEIKKKFEKMRDGDGDKKTDEDLTVTFGIPGFDEFEEEAPMVPDFYLSEDSALLQSGPLESRYERSILSQVERALQINDKNKDGVIDGNEIRQGRWQRPASESDLNKDGKLTKVELAERYVKNANGRGRIEKGKKTSSSNSRSSSKRDVKKRSSSRSSFGSRSSRSGGSSSRSSTSQDDKITSYAKTMVKKYDKNGDGKLDSSESAGVRSLPRNADKNGDKIISLDEMIVAYGGKVRSSSSTSSSRRKSNANNRYLISNGADRSEAADSDFQKLDKNVDGLIQMHEYAKSWTDELASAFAKLDVNNDGQITVAEWKKGGGARASKSSSRYSRSRGR